MLSLAGLQEMQQWVFTPTAVQRVDEGSPSLVYAFFRSRGDFLADRDPLFWRCE
ncbi:MAG: hypothetical protein MPJ22_09720 [Pirellulales bacterium]|nr:hypothetical protein [Pirellulales bacterium]